MNYEAAGTFSNYFSVNGETLPLGYWVDWPMHWLATATDVVPLLRLPGLLAVIAGWAIARWALGCCSPDAAASLPGRCTLAGVYLVGSVAWLVTLRPEPMVALLTVGSLAAAVSFAKRPSARSLAVGAVLTALAVSLHPAGFVVAAPFIASAPLLVRWIGAAPRERVAACAAITFSGGALAVVLVGLDSDLGTLAAATREFRAGTEHGANWRAEILRYSGLDLEGWNTPPRRLFVAFALLAALAYAARRDRERRWPEDLPALAVVAALALLVATPSKWPWHFGALVGLAAVAMAVEAQRFIAAGAGSRVGAFVRPLAAIALVTTATTWAAVNPTPWAALDLRTLEWGAEVGPFHLGSTKQWAAAVILALAAGAVWRLARGHSIAALPWRYAAWILPVAAASVIVSAVAMFVRDAVDTPGWTLARQSVDGLLDRSTCGIGDEAVVADPASLRPLQPVASTPPPPARGAWLADERPPVPGLRTWDSAGAAGGVARFETPWFLAPASRPIGLFVAGRLEGRVGARVQWGRSVGDRVKPFASRAIRLRDEVAGSPLSPWSLVPAKRMPSRPAGATHVRVLAVDRDIEPAAWLSVSGPVSYARSSLAAVARRAGVTLVHPTLNLYLPCARLPRLAGGRAERAHLLVLPSGSPWPVGDSNSPFNLDEAARVVELPLDETPDEIEGLRVYSLVWSPRPGEEVVPASTRVVTD
jgi:hypothetical protein